MTNAKEGGQWAWEAGKQWYKHGQHSSGVANARVVTYGFARWFNSLHPDDLKGIRKAYLLNSFREGFTTAKRSESDSLKAYRQNPHLGPLGERTAAAAIKAHPRWDAAAFLEVASGMRTKASMIEYRPGQRQEAARLRKLAGIYEQAAGKVGVRNPAGAGIGAKSVLCRVKRVGNKLHITKVGR